MTTVFVIPHVPMTPSREMRAVWLPVAAEKPAGATGVEPSSVSDTTVAGRPARSLKVSAWGLVPPVNVTVNVKSMKSGHETEVERWNVNGVAFEAVPPPPMFG